MKVRQFIKTYFLGLQKEDVEGKSPFQMAAAYASIQDRTVTQIAGLTALLLLGGGLWGLIGHHDMSPLVPYIALLISLLALVSTRMSIIMPLLQMKQAEDQTAQTARLSAAIDMLSAELRCRPRDISW